ncbi:DUF456 domain-containing protein [Evansella cellulosilytica]|uniref:DUF456 domain-containing protein n=1 Tax=Evansella cellulosilytica (strain ATCC 21833 / DSM 2522 / FERM P-1141 / JCM 9156 / N-4) TaxID=649639 RepID=E6TT15_EVAC2|nr:DUF456 family protein [Evansella cellulosilytica]ADU31923.1 protein of unknown function DUF456 [Evansella cellulosilytica DSM 2522]
MSFLIWFLIIACFVISFIGLIYPIIPGILFIWIGIALYQFFIPAGDLAWWFWVSLTILTILVFVADLLANLFFVKKYGGSQLGMYAATAGLIVGCFIIPPIGVLIFPFLFVLGTELYQKKTFEEAVKVSIGTLFAFLSGTVAKGFIHVLIIVLFLINVIFFN